MLDYFGKINDNLEQQAQAIFKSWFVDFEPFRDGKFVESELGLIPAGWTVITLAQIAEFYSGYSYKGSELSSSQTAMATIKNFDRKGGFKTDGFKEIKPSTKLKPWHTVNPFEILVAHTDLTQSADVIGRAEMLLSKAGYDNVIFSLDLVKVLPKNTSKMSIDNYLLAAILNSSNFKSYALGYVNGTTVLHLGKKALPNYKFAYPINKTVLYPLSTVLESFAQQKASLFEQNIELAILRDTLLPKLMSGEIDVSNIAI